LKQKIKDEKNKMKKENKEVKLDKRKKLMKKAN